MLSEADVSDPFIGQVINGKFRILTPIGQGGMGKIYRAEQLPLGRPVALKVLRQSTEMAENDPAFQRRFFLEASLCAKLSHPNIVTIYDYGKIDNVEGEAYFLAMEFLDGVTLTQRMRERGGALTVNESLAVGVEIARGLREAHKHGIVHRDLKPGNVMLVPDEEHGEKVKIVDFGLVKQVEGEDKEDLTRENSCLGSPRYMSPEQVDGSNVDHRTDLYSLGIILYQCLSGRVPFEFEKSVLILMAHVSTPVPPMRDRNPLADVPPNIEAYVRRLLEKKPEARPASADEVIQGLRSLQHEQGAITHSTQSPIPRTSLGLGPIAPNTEGHAASENSAGTLVPAVKNPSATGGRSKAPLLIGAAVLLLLGGAGAMALRGRGNTASTNSADSTRTAAQPTPARTERTLRIESTPAGAAVTENERALGNTPLTIPLDPAMTTPRTFTLSLGGYQSYSLTQGPTNENVRVVAPLVALAQVAAPTPPTATPGTATPATATATPAPEPTPATNPPRSSVSTANTPVVRRGARVVTPPPRQQTTPPSSLTTPPPRSGGLDIQTER